MIGPLSFGRQRGGYLLIEGLIAIALLAIFVGFTTVTFLFAHDSSLSSGDRARSVYLSEQAMEAVLSMRDQSFSLLTTGTHGLAVDATGKWAFSGSVSTGTGGFRTSVAISSVAGGLRRATVTTTWPQGRGGTGSVVLTSDISDWRSVKQPGDWVNMIQAGQYVDSGTPLFSRAVRVGNTLFVTGDTTSGGRGLYLFDLTTISSPQRLASSFDLGYTGRDLAIKGTTLYVLTDDPGAELKVYDVSAPSSFSSSNLITSYNLPGSGLGRSLLRAGNALYVGAADDATEAQLYAFSIPSASVVTLSGSLRDPGGSMLSLSLSGKDLYAADSNNVSELRIVNVSTGSSLKLVSGSGYNLSDTQDGLAVIVSGTSALLGRAAGSAIEEVVLFVVNPGAAPASPGPWYHNAGAAVNGFAFESSGQYAFIATESASKELIVLSPALLRQGASPELTTRDLTTGIGRGVSYDPWSDRLFVLTATAIHIYAPGS